MLRTQDGQKFKIISQLCAVQYNFILADFRLSFIFSVAGHIYFDMSEGIEKVKSDVLRTWEKIKGIKNIKIIALIFIIAISLIIYSSVATSKQTEKTFQNEDELRLASILSSIDGAGEVETMISKSSDEIVGVLVIAEGASNPLVRLRLLQAASSALGVDSDVVSVLSRKN